MGHSVIRDAVGLSDNTVMAAAKQTVEIEGRRVNLSNLDKILYPGRGFTKAQVIDYYARIAPVMLAHQRHPRGNPLVRTYMDRDFRRPKDFASFLYVGQVLQATVIKYAAEARCASGSTVAVGTLISRPTVISSTGSGSGPLIRLWLPDMVTPRRGAARARPV